MKLLLTLTLLATLLTAGKYDTVKITEDISHIMTYHKGKATRVHRIQDVKHQLTGSYAKISHPCPDMCIQPIKMSPEIETIGEVELIEFMQDRVNSHKGAIIDTRPKDDYETETIPSSISIPFNVSEDDEAMDSIFGALGMKKESDGKWNSSKAQELVIYCNGLWCSKSSQFINSMVKRGYPAEKIKYYRGGFQMWKILGFTTVKSK